MSGIRIAPDEGERIPVVRVTTGSSPSCPSSKSSIFALAPGFSVDPHSHQDHVDSFFVLEGEAEFQLGDDVVHAGAGTSVSAPIGVLHGFQNVGEGELRILNIQAPSVGFASRLRANS